MSDEVSTILGQAIGTFFQSIPPTAHYRGMGGDVEIPTPAELTLVGVFVASPPRTREDLLAIAQKLTMAEAYRLCAFSVRMATLAVRMSAVHILRAGAFGMVIDDNLVDWRDFIVGFSVIDDCAMRLGVDLRSVMQAAIHVASDKRRRTIVDGYLTRPPEMRGIRVMEIEALDGGEKLKYRCKPWYKA